MIKSFKHKGVRKFFITGNKAGIQPAHVARLSRQLLRLGKATVATDMNMPGWHLHSLKGNKAGRWAVSVSGNWRLTFRFEDGHAHDVDYDDYH